MSDPLPPDPNSIIQPHTTIIVGFSGGPDSVCLLHVLCSQKKELNLQIIATHLDHEWQESSKIAAELCKNMCDNLGVDLVIKKLSELEFDVKWNGSQEEVGRVMRRHFFQSVAQQHQADAIALAHHEQDQHETFFIRLLRGSSLKGLTGIQKKDGLYIRPLLHWSKNQIMQYLHDNNLNYYTDQTNTSDAYLRNRIRNHVIPALHATDTRFEKNLTSTMSQLSLAHDFIEQQTCQMMQTMTTPQGISIALFLDTHTVVQQNILLRLLIISGISFTPSQKLFNEIMRFLKKSSKNKHTLYQNCLIKKDKNYFSIEKLIKIDKNL